MPQKTFEFTRRTEATAALDLSQAGSPQEALDKVGFSQLYCGTHKLSHCCPLLGLHVLNCGCRLAVLSAEAALPDLMTVKLEVVLQVLRLPAVCSKRFLTTKVDRCVTGVTLS